MVLHWNTHGYAARLHNVLDEAEGGREAAQDAGRGRPCRAPSGRRATELFHGNCRSVSTTTRRVSVVALWSRLRCRRPTARRVAPGGQCACVRAARALCRRRLNTVVKTCSATLSTARGGSRRCSRQGVTQNQSAGAHAACLGGRHIRPAWPALVRCTKTQRRVSPHGSSGAPSGGPMGSSQSTGGDAGASYSAPQKASWQTKEDRPEQSGGGGRCVVVDPIPRPAAFL